MAKSFFSKLFGKKDSDKAFQKVKKDAFGDDRKTEINDNERFSDGSEFSYSAQYAHFESNQIEQKGACSLEGFLGEFENFNWLEQLEEANKNQKVSPTLSLRYNPTNHEMGISIMGKNAKEYSYLVFFGKFGDMNSTETDDEEQIKNYITMFFNRDFKELEGEIV